MKKAAETAKKIFNEHYLVLYEVNNELSEEINGRPK